MEEISATVKKNAENAQASQSIGQRHARSSPTAAARWSPRRSKPWPRSRTPSRKISDIIGVIDEIACQTNLCWLNAAVEAARAGEAGRGFAVVASEVRSLAQRSSQAAKDIKDLITNSNGQVKDGVELVNRAGTALTEIVESIKKVAEIVADIANASAEQATGIEQVNKALARWTKSPSRTRRWSRKMRPPPPRPSSTSRVRWMNGSPSSKYKTGWSAGLAAVTSRSS